MSSINAAQLVTLDAQKCVNMHVSYFFKCTESIWGVWGLLGCMKQWRANRPQSSNPTALQYPFAILVEFLFPGPILYVARVGSCCCRCYESGAVTVRFSYVPSTENLAVLPPPIPSPHGRSMKSQ